MAIFALLTAASVAQAQEYYLYINGQNIGPITPEAAFQTPGFDLNTTMVAPVGSSSWVAAKEVPDFIAAAPEGALEKEPAENTANESQPEKFNIAAWLKSHHAPEVCSVVVGLTVMIILFKPFFGNFSGFLECVRYNITPDIFSWFRGEGMKDWWAEMRLGGWALCGFGSGYGVYLGITKFLT